ncbi:uncharacterized protein [Nicotiana sylvestris]|uniref:uncharacterized protein n=1 Tax=Nicotiana sylvestris TaxID=4096 RepID=UPI00388C7E3A
MEVYIDDMLVMSLCAEDHLTHLQEAFNILRKYNMKLNPEKCAFGVGLDKFLGFMVSNQAIEINPDKIKAIEDITVMDNVKVVQRLTGRIAALGRFISRASDKSHRFFSLLKKKNYFAWTRECQQALKELKRWRLNVKGTELGIVLKPLTGNTIRQSIKTPKLTNNEAEYEAMIACLELAKSLGAEIIEAKCDSLLVVNQVNRTFEVREDRIQRYLDKLQVALHRFKNWNLQYVPREQNNEPHALANLRSSVEDDEISSGLSYNFQS